MKNLRTIILAAGKGARMKSDIPKVLHPVCGEPIINYVLDVAKDVGSNKTYVVLGHKSDRVKNQLSPDLVVIEQKKLLGTADAVKTAEPLLKSFSGDVLILCGDTPLLKKSVIKTIIRKHRRMKSTCTFLTAVVHDPQGYGRIIRGEDGGVVAIREDKDASGYEREIAEINVGVYCFQSKILFSALKAIKLNQKKKEYYLTDIIELLFQNKSRIETVETEDPTEGLGINNKEDLALAESVLRRIILKEFMFEGVTIIDPNTTYIDADVKIGKDTIIKPFTVIESKVRIGSQCTIGPFARIRGGSKIGNNVEIGNYTEVSRTKVGDRTIMKHFSYLGDAVLGSNVNIGAGAVTANFDGKDKNITKISDHAFIGSNAVLVAPARVGKKSSVGAGSVLTRGKSVPDGKTAAGVPAKMITPKRK